MGFREKGGSLEVLGSKEGAGGGRESPDALNAHPKDISPHSLPSSTMHSERTEREDAFSYPGGLPYDEGQTVPLPLDPPSHQRPIDDLDRPLDDLIEESAPPRRTHGRSRGMRSDGEVEYVPQPRGDEGGWKPTQKLYLLSEVDATVHHRMVRSCSPSFLSQPRTSPG